MWCKTPLAGSPVCPSRVLIVLVPSQTNLFQLSHSLGVWEPGIAIDCAQPDPRSELGVLCTGEADSLQLQVFYLSPKREIRRAIFNFETSNWDESHLEDRRGGKITALRGSSLAVTQCENKIYIFYLSGPRNISVLKEDGEGTFREMKRHRACSRWYTCMQIAAFSDTSS